MKNRVYFLLIKKILGGIGLLFLIATFNFSIIRLMPGDAVVNVLGESEYYRLVVENPERIEELKVKFGLDKTIGQQYLLYLDDLIHLDFGYSYINKQAVWDYVTYHLKWTILLSVPTVFLSALIGGFLGLWCGWHSNGKLDRVLTPIALFLHTVPSNFVSILFLIVFSYRLKWFPLSGMTSGGLHGMQKILDVIWHMMLPLFILVLFRTGENILHMKSYSSRVRNEEYIITAIAKGIPENRVMMRHGLKNVALPYLTLICMQLGHLLSGSMMIEVVFSWQGMGMLMYNAAQNKDYPVLQLGLLLISACVIIFNLLSDVLNLLIDPRIREEVG